MRHITTIRLRWLLLGFVLGCLFSFLHAAWNLWPFQEDALLAWVRWAGKETIKWSYVAVIFGVVVFIAVQVLNGVVAARALKQDEQQRRS